jgi:hypothetical protein
VPWARRSPSRLKFQTLQSTQSLTWLKFKDQLKLMWSKTSRSSSSKANPHGKSRLSTYRTSTWTTQLPLWHWLVKLRLSSHRRLLSLC